MMVSWLIISAVVIASLIVLQNFMDKVYLDTVGKYVLITGCDSGFGNLLARTLGKQRGCHVIAACLTKDAAVQLKRDMAGTGQVVTPILLDVRSSESIRKAYQEVQRIIPPGQGLWGLVNNAGINKPGGPYEWLTREEINTIFQVNFLGTVEVTSTFLPLLIQAHGRVVNMSSCTAMLPMVGTAYAASKTAVEAYSDNLRQRVRRLGITVHILQPGAFKTSISDPEIILSSRRKLWDRLTEDERQRYGGIQMFKREEALIRTKLQDVSPNLHHVTGTIEHALCARWPWRRYLPGSDAKFLFKPLSLMPAFVVDNIFNLII
ncbi:short-chain dehydrogenase/reductase family 9C member 7-like isoform X1 [Acanthaster planci]|uniref:Short-chain dehydrogenase/reductase family 9C member 7-like isoform X1 n=1 Tax=Acanthaster planci TaxID=133434 RepID=A0A8B7YG66_ACAPL|nr:short-chain dehydrogenase/reductase family 9C member 7-like isoform X1 [Acanthaster planci]XP_022090637.1 short-chain dehydrogenase/reductase family 9C member 7-like isoform X1 [Acanthaster planci]